MLLVNRIYYTKKVKVFAAVLTLLGAAALTIGFYDAFAADSLGDRLLGSLVLVSGASLTWGAAAYLSEKLSKNTQLLLLLLGPVPGVSLVGAEVNSNGLTWYVALWAATAIGPIVLIGLVIYKGARPARLYGLAWGSIAATAVGVAPAVAAGLYQPLPSHQALNLDVQSRVVTTRPGLAGEEVAVLDVEITAKNIGKQDLRILAGTYSISARMQTPREGVLGQWQVAEEFSANRWTGRFENQDKVDLVETGLIYEGDTFLSADQTNVSKFQTLIPLQEYNAASIWVSLLTSFNNQLRLGVTELNDRFQPGVGEMTMTFPIENSGLMDKLVNRTEAISVAYGIEAAESSHYDGLYYELRVDERFSKQVPFDENDHAEVSKAGITTTQTVKEISLDASD